MMINLDSYRRELIEAVGCRDKPLRELFITLYLCDQLSTQEISELTGGWPTSVAIRKWMKGLNIPIRPKGGRQRELAEYTPKLKEFSEEEYHTSTLIELTRKYKVHYTTILRYARQKGYAKKRNMRVREEDISG